jgi:hypothetical protein
MGFFKNKADSIQADVASGNTARVEQAARDIVHAMLEGAGTHAQNLDALTRAVENGKPRKSK